MSQQPHDTLKVLHHKTGEVISMCNHLLTAVVVLGSVFCLMLVGAFKLAQNPEQVLRTQSFMFNYAEFSQAEALPTADEEARRRDDETANYRQDPDWDGMVAGAGMGWAVGRNIPLVGVVAGPVVGAYIGHRLDSRI